MCPRWGIRYYFGKDTVGNEAEIGYGVLLRAWSLMSLERQQVVIIRHVHSERTKYRPGMRVTTTQYNDSAPMTVHRPDQGGKIQQVTCGVCDNGWGMKVSSLAAARRIRRIMRLIAAGALCAGVLLFIALGRFTTPGMFAISFGVLAGFAVWATSFTWHGLWFDPVPPSPGTHRIITSGPKGKGSYG